MNDSEPVIKGKSVSSIISAEELNNSIQMQVNLWIESESFDYMVAQIYEHIKKNLGKCRNRYEFQYKTYLKIIVLNLIVAYMMNPYIFVAYSRNDRDKTYHKSSVYNKNGVSRAIIKVIDALIEAGYISDDIKGFFDRTRGTGKLSRMRASFKLIKLTIRESVNDDSLVLNSEEIVLRSKKDKNKRFKDLEYDDTPEIIAKREIVKLVNNLINSAVIELPVNEDQYEELRSLYSDGCGPFSPVFLNRKLRRIFCNGRFDNGGRFYGHWVQELPSQFRKLLWIDGENVCECDYSGYQIHILYALENLPDPVGDVYEVDGYSSKGDRELFKKILHSVLNADSAHGAYLGVLKDIRGKTEYKGITYDKIKEMAEALMDKHHQIKHHFHSGIGVKLQYTDSNIAEKVLMELAGKGIVTIPVHDSFVVKRKHKADLIQAMKNGYRTIIGRDPKIDVK